MAHFVRGLEQNARDARKFCEDANRALKQSADERLRQHTEALESFIETANKTQRDIDSAHSREIEAANRLIDLMDDKLDDLNDSYLNNLKKVKVY